MDKIVKISVREEVNKTIYEVCKVIQKVCTEEHLHSSINMLPDIVQSAAEMIKSATDYID